MKKTRILAALAAIAFASERPRLPGDRRGGDVTPTTITVKATGGKNKGEVRDGPRADTKVSATSRRAPR